MRIYLAANYSAHPLMQAYCAILEDLGHEVTSRWIQGTHSESNKESEYAKIDLYDLDNAEMIVFFSEQFPNSRIRGGKHVEFGYALAKEKQIVIIGDRKNVFHYLDCIRRFETFNDFCKDLKL
jgi:hypothetical protein